MKTGEINNCEKCNSSYGQYDNNPESDWSEYWCEQPIKKEPKGLCQFCNKDSKLFKNAV